MTEPRIQVRDLWKIYELGDVQVPALRGVSTDIRAAEFVAVMGASGSGKSTFMNIVGCLDRPTRGIYRLEGTDVSTLSADQRATIRNQQIGFVFQNFNLLVRTSAIENVELPLFYSDVPLAKQRQRAREALAAVGLSGREEHVPSQLSGGQQQRVAIARALINRPSVLLADEPTGNLDTQTSMEILAIFRQLNRDQGITIVLVTHEPDIAAYAERVITFRDGEIVSDVQQRAAVSPLPPGTVDCFANSASTSSARAVEDSLSNNQSAHPEPFDSAQDGLIEGSASRLSTVSPKKDVRGRSR